MMYHESTYEEESRRHRRMIGLVLAFALLAVLVWQGMRASHALTREQGAAALRESVLRASVQCCAVEGSYPTSIEHLEEHYGLVINAHDYQVNYEWLGDNIPPSVVVVAL